MDLGTDPGAGPRRPALGMGAGPVNPAGPPTLIGPGGCGVKDVAGGGTTTDALTPGGPRTGTVPTPGGTGVTVAGADARGRGAVTPGGPVGAAGICRATHISTQGKLIKQKMDSQFHTHMNFSLSLKLCDTSTS